MKRLLSAVVFGFLATARAQTQPGVPAFQNVDVHLSQPGTAMNGGRFAPGARFEADGYTMIDLIARAYGLSREKITGGPDWLDTLKFDIVASVPASAPRNGSRPMLQALLADRFGLSVHQGTKMRPVYALARGRQFHLKPTTAGGESRCTDSTEKGNDVFVCSSATIQAFADAINDTNYAFMDRLVVDATHSTDLFDFEVRWVWRGPMPDASRSEGLAKSLREAIEKQLGLTVEATQAELPVIVVDHVNSTPTPNAPGVVEALRSAAPLEFEAAEVRPHPAGVPFSFATYNDRADMRGLSLRILIAEAYNVKGKSLVGEPGWVDTETFDIIAKAARPVPWENMQIMLQNLIEDRFHLAYHKAQAPIPVYALTVGKQPLKLRAADPHGRSDCRWNIAAAVYTLTCQNTTMAQLIERLPTRVGDYLDLPAVDLTGLTGGFDFSVTWSSLARMNAAAGAARPADSSTALEASTPTGDITLFEALDRTLGLKLQKQEHLMPVMVVDRVERPSDN